MPTDYRRLVLPGALILLTALALLGQVNPFIAALILIAVLLLRLSQGAARRAAGRPDGAAPASRALGLHIAAAALLTLGGMPLFGLPGLLVLMLTSPILDLLFGARAIDRLPMYGGLSLAFMLTLIWPTFLVVAYLVAYRACARLDDGQKMMVYLGVAYGSALLLSVGAYLLVLR